MNNLEEDIKASDYIYRRCLDDNYATLLYSALTNIQWCKIDSFDMIKEEHWSGSFRYVAALIADIRNKNENYMDWYCSGPEGAVDDKILTDLRKLGWFPIEWDDD